MSLAFFSVCGAYAQQTCTYTDQGSNATYVLNSQESLCITSGTFTGTIQSFPAGASILVSAGASFAPASMTQAYGLIKNNGTVTFSTVNALEEGFSLVNENSAFLAITAPQVVNGSVQITNDKSSTISLQTAFTLPMGSNFANEGIVQCYGDFSGGLASSFSNDGLMHVFGSFSSDGLAYNTGIMKVYGESHFNPNASFINKCTFLSAQSLTNQAGKFENHGYIQLFAATGDRQFNNLQDLYNDVKGIIQSADFHNSGNIRGGGQFIVSGQSTNSGSFGFDGGGMNFYDASPTGNQHFDVETTAPHVSVTKNAAGAYDTTYISGSCNKISFPQSPNSPLPVILSSFSALNRDCLPVLEWSTSQEINSNYFEIERRSSSDLEFVRIATVNAQVNSTTTTNYTFTDEAMENGQYQYRLRMVDLDGHASYSRVAALNKFCGAEHEISLYPNPAHDRASLSFTAEEADLYEVLILDMMGRKMRSTAFDLAAGFQTLPIDLSGLLTGQYHVLIKNSKQTTALKLSRY